MNKIAHYRCAACGCEVVVCFVGMEPLADVECQDCHARARMSYGEERGYAVGDRIITIERLEQGFLLHVGGGALGFSDALDMADWLLCWADFDTGVAAKVRDVLTRMGGYAMSPLMDECAKGE